MREHGITTSEAYWWVFVCPKDAAFYCLRTATANKMLSCLRKAEIPTAKGFLLPIVGNRTWEGGFIFANYAEEIWFRQWPWSGKTDADIGEMGEKCFQKACQIGIVRMPVSVGRFNTIEEQYKGKDFALSSLGADVEVKTDLPGGVWGTGNLFLQTHERQHTRSTEL